MSISSVEALHLDDDESLHGSENAETNEQMDKLKHVAHTGSMSLYDWSEIKSIVHSRLLEIVKHYIDDLKSEQQSLQQNTTAGSPPVTPLYTSSTATEESPSFNNAEKSIEELKREEQNLTKLVDQMDEPPFTLQRICELLYEPARYYDKGDKFVRAIEKNLRVISPHEEPKELDARITNICVENTSQSNDNSTCKPEQIEDYQENEQIHNCNEQHSLMSTSHDDEELKESKPINQQPQILQPEDVEDL